jgi:hypothetical protein
MPRVHIELDDDLTAYLKREANAAGESLAARITGILAASRDSDEHQRRIEIAIAALEKPAFRSDVPDLGENHDEYIGQILDDEVERWRRG